MGKYVVEGGNRLFGEIDVNGAKNSALPILAASVLNGGVNIIHNVPLLSDTKNAIEMLRYLGCNVVENKKTVIIDSSTISKTCLPKELTTKMRSSIIFMGSLFGRFKEIEICHPGGCELGKRPIDLHIEAMKKMGVKFKMENDKICASAAKLEGTEIKLNYPSVGATQNIILTAVLAEGVTIIKNAAQEPEIYDLQCFLNKMGARVAGAGSDTVVIRGVSELGSVEHSIIPDRIEAGTYLCAAAITGSELKLNNIISPHLKPINSVMAKLGCIIIENKNSLIIKSPLKPEALKELRTYPHPGFPTDMQPQVMAVATIASGRSIIYETVFEDRYKHALELNKMGSKIKIFDKNKFVVEGIETLKGAHINATDLRSGAALIVAALAAEGTSVISGAEHIERGYENIDAVFRKIGANIVKED